MPRLAVLFFALLASVAATPGVVAAEVSPEIDAAIRRGVTHLKRSIGGSSGNGRAVLAALALVKAGEPVDGKEVQAVVASVQGRCSGAEYKPEHDHYYTAGLELMLLEAIDPERFREEMAKILAYVLAGQRTSGAWYYPDQPGGLGDTSITQYALLGLWASDRAGLHVPRETWDRAAAWHLRTQVRDGGFAYHPGEPNPDDNNSRATLTVGGAANLLLARMHLFPGGAKDKPAPDPVPDAREERTGKLFGVLESIDATTDQNDDAAESDRSYAVKSRPDAIDRSVLRAVAWSEARFKLPPDTAWKMYYIYGLERMASLGNMAQLGNHDWYKAGAQWLVSAQAENGSWPDFAGDVAGTAFGVLFLTRSTGKMLGRTYEVAELGGGLLIGGRGLPDDLGRVNVAGGKVEARTSGGPLDELLGRLEGVGAADVPAVQQAVLEAVRFGDREKLISERERLRRLVKDPRAEVRRTAVWALGRGGELTDVPLMIEILADPDVTVAIEAHNALCVLSRRPLAFGIPGSPLTSVTDETSDAERERLIDDWRKKATTAWTDWYRRVAPYEERDGLGLFR